MALFLSVKRGCLSDTVCHKNDTQGCCDEATEKKAHNTLHCCICRFHNKYPLLVVMLLIN